MFNSYKNYKFALFFIKKNINIKLLKKDSTYLQKVNNSFYYNINKNFRNFQENIPNVMYIVPKDVPAQHTINIIGAADFETLSMVEDLNKVKHTYSNYSIVNIKNNAIIKKSKIFLNKNNKKFVYRSLNLIKFSRNIINKPQSNKKELLLQPTTESINNAKSNLDLFIQKLPLLKNSSSVKFDDKNVKQFAQKQASSSNLKKHQIVIAASYIFLNKTYFFKIPNKCFLNYNYKLIKDESDLLLTKFINIFKED